MVSQNKPFLKLLLPDIDHSNRKVVETMNGPCSEGECPSYVGGLQGILVATVNIVSTNPAL